MRLLIYEWSCSGGLTATAVQAEGPPDSIGDEGRLMFLALLRDAVRDPALTVTALVDARRPLDLPAGVVRWMVSPGTEIDTLVAAARSVDATLIVAPETAGILADRVGRLRHAGARVLAPDARFIEIAADKQATIDALAAAGVPVPAGRSLAAGEAWPAGFVTPSVRKARTGAGGEDLLVVRVGDPLPPPAPRATRLERLAVGVPVGVSCLCGPAGIALLPAMRQRFSCGVAPRFLGSEPLADRTLADRAGRLARRAIAAVAQAGRGPVGLPATPAGWVGVDMILGSCGGGRYDRVLEVNPRLTTSFAGHAASSERSLVRAMLEAAAGREPLDTSATATPPLAFELSSHDTTASRRPAGL